MTKETYTRPLFPHIHSPSFIRVRECVCQKRHTKETYIYRQRPISYAATTLQLRCNYTATPGSWSRLQKIPIYTDRDLQATLQLHCNCTATPLQLHCNYTATTLQLHCKTWYLASWSHLQKKPKYTDRDLKATLQLHCNSTATTLPLHCNYSATTLQLHCNSTATTLQHLVLSELVCARH